MPVPTPPLMTGTQPDRYQPEPVDVTGAADLTWVRDDVDIARFYASVDDPEERGTMIRDVLAMIGPSLLATDVLVANGQAQFGQTPLQLPNCTITGYSPVKTQWMSEVRHDVPGGSAFLSGTNTTVRDMYFSDVCHDSTEDGSCIGFISNASPQSLTIERCVLDGSQGCDWTVYNWTVGSTIVVRDCEISSCRFGIAAAYSGSGHQSVTVERTRFHLDANGSQSLGASSGADPVTGGVLAGIMCRRGTVTVTDVEFYVTGLTAAYSGFSVPRVALITDQYFTVSGERYVTINGLYVKEYIPGVESVVNVIDLRDTSPTSTLTIVENDLRPASELPAFP